MRRKMILMAQIVTLSGLEEETHEITDAKKELKRMTLKEFMMSDSQRSQVDTIDWEKDITSTEKV